MLDYLLTSLDNDIYRQEAELVALRAELAAAPNPEKAVLQMAVDNAVSNVNKLQSRLAAWTNMRANAT